MSYFFCQATNDGINNASAALRGLIYLLIDQQPLLISHVRKKYDYAGTSVQSLTKSASSPHSLEDSEPHLKGSLSEVLRDHKVLQ